MMRGGVRARYIDCSPASLPINFLKVNYQQNDAEEIGTLEQ